MDREIYLKKIIIAVGVLIILSLVGILVYFYMKEPDINGDNVDYGGNFNEPSWYNNEKELNITSSDYIVVRDIIRQYLNTINDTNALYYSLSGAKIISNEEVAQMAFNKLLPAYTEKNGITQSNIFNHIKKYNMQNEITLLEIKKLTETTKTVSAFAIKVLVQNVDNYSVEEELYFIVYLDDNNSTYAIEPIETNDISKISLNNEFGNIEVNDDNKFRYMNINDKEVLDEYIDKFIKVAIGAPEYAYNNMLNKEYRDKKFGSVEKFKEYIETNKSRIRSIKLQKYNKNSSNPEYMQYTSVDQYDNYYIIREKSMIVYDLILDAYTIDLPEFIKDYSKATDKNKILMNMEKIRQAINNHDYEYVYNKLSTDSKQNNLSDIEKLENYINNNMFNLNKMEINDINSENDLYTFKVIITDLTKESEEKKEMEFNMKLMGDTNFEITFF